MFVFQLFMFHEFIIDIRVKYVYIKKKVKKRLRFYLTVYNRNNGFFFYFVRNYQG